MSLTPDTSYASSEEIQAYLKAFTFHYGIHKHITFRSKVEKAVWSEVKSVWTVSVAEKGNFECEFLINAGGILNNISYPVIEDLHEFSGPLLHTAAWNKDTNLAGKRVAIIGAGASAIQCLPAIQNQVDHVDIYIRTPSWITPPAGGSINPERNHEYTQEEIAKFKEDAEHSLSTRQEMESVFNRAFKTFIQESDEQRAVKSDLETYMKGRVTQPELQASLIPKFDVGCRRINPGEAYLEALQKDNVQPIFKPIERATPAGLVADGVLRHYDVLIAATGFDTSFRPRFPIIGEGGKDLRELWKEDPSSYLGVAVSGFPNYLMFLGPNTPISNGSLMGSLEATADYFIKILEKVMREEVVSVDVRQEAQADFNSHTQQIMKKMVWSGPCSSWYKSKNGNVTALWPGSSLHYRQVLASCRWEDFEWRYNGNRFACWGQGFSDVEKEGKTKAEDLAYYMKEHESLPLEAYYLAAKGYPAQVRPSLRFKPADETISGTASFSDRSWDTSTADALVYEAAALSV